MNGRHVWQWLPVTETHPSFHIYTNVQCDYFCGDLTSTKFSVLYISSERVPRSKHQTLVSILSINVLKSVTNQNRNIFFPSNYGQPSLITNPCEFHMLVNSVWGQWSFMPLVLESIRCGEGSYVFYWFSLFALHSIFVFHFGVAISSSANTRR